MNDAEREAVQGWLFKAKRDLAAARRLASKRSPMLDAAVYHCQQSAEKALKGFLVFQAYTPPKTHALNNLIGITSTFAPIYATLLDAADRLTPYATRFRYPAQLLEPSRADYEHALADAAELLRVTLTLIPREAHPPRSAPKPPTAG